MKRRTKKKTSEGALYIPNLTAECHCPRCGALLQLTTSSCMNAAQVSLKRKS